MLLMFMRLWDACVIQLRATRAISPPCRVLFLQQDGTPALQATLLAMAFGGRLQD